MLSGASSFAAQVDKIFLWILGISVFFLVLITFLMIFFVIKYRRSKHTTPENIHGNTLLEITWIVIPTILVLGMFYYGWVSYSIMKNVPEGAETITVLGRMWSWQFEYQNGLQTDTLFVPLGIPVKLELASQDVLHGFYVPAFRVKRDVVPGLRNYVWFEPRILGTYDILCTEYCGLEHSYMLATLSVLTENEYKTWYKSNSPESSVESSKDAKTAEGAKGRELIVKKGCIACHSTDGSASVGPTFLGVFGQQVAVITDGKERLIEANSDYLRKSMLNPAADITKRFEPLMPSSEGQLTDKEIDEIIQFIKGLQ